METELIELKVCGSCGQKWELHPTYGQVHSCPNYTPIVHVFRDDFDKRYQERQKVLKAHKQGKLPSYYYSRNPKGKPTLLPKTLYKYGA